MRDEHPVILLGVFLVLSLTVLLSFAAACTDMRVRKEIRDLSPEELNRFHAAIKQLNTKAAGETYSKWDSMTKLHLSNDWSIDSQAPERSIVFHDAYFGGNGDPSNNGCLSTGPYTNWFVSVPQSHCLSRAFNGGTKISSFVAPVIQALIISQSNDYDAFRQAIESTPHAAPHINIGGDMKTMYSPNDPLFYLHHAYIDKVWHSFQQKGHGRFLDAFNSETNPKINVNYIMVPFNITVASILDPLSVCYQYQEPSTVHSGSRPPSFGPTTSSIASDRGSVASSSDNFQSETVLTSTTDMVSKFNFSATFLLGSNGTLLSSTIFSNNQSAVDLAYSILDAIVGSSQAALQVKNPNFFEKMFSVNKTLIESRNPDSLDRSELRKLRLPLPIEEEYINHMGMDMNAVRNIEAALNTLYDLSNNS